MFNHGSMPDWISPLTGSEQTIDSPVRSKPGGRKKYVTRLPCPAYKVQVIIDCPVWSVGLK